MCHINKNKHNQRCHGCSDFGDCNHRPADGGKIGQIVHLYDKSVSCVHANGLQSMWFEMSGIRQGCVMSPDSFATGMDYLLERSVGIGINGVSFGDHSY